MAPLQQQSIVSSSGDTASAIDVEMEETKEGVKKPAQHDVLCGRGGSINTHPGNESFRKLIVIHKRSYLTARFKKDKRIITDSIIKEISDRGGKFLSRDNKTDLWVEVSMDKAREKTSQALRENGPKLREAMERENEDIRRTKHRGEEQQRRSEIYNHQYGIDPNISHDSLHRSPHNHKSSDQPYYADRRSANQATPQRDQRMYDSTPRYNTSKSFVESIAEAFACPTSLDDVYSKTQKFFPSTSPSPPQMQEETSPTHIGQKRNYHQPTKSSYQHRDDWEHWNSTYHQTDYVRNDTYSKQPVYYELPSQKNHSRPHNIEQRNPKRAKGTNEYFASLTMNHPGESESQYKSSSSTTMSWNPFPSWSKAAPSPIYRTSLTPKEEGQEVQLITRVGSMTMHDYSDNVEEELRTPPPDDEQLKSEQSPVAKQSKKPTSNYDWTSMSSCNNFFFTDLLGLNKVQSFDLNASDNDLQSGDLNGASLVNVFSDGENGISVEEKTLQEKGHSSEMTISFTDLDRVLAS